MSRRVLLPLLTAVLTLGTLWAADPPKDPAKEPALPKPENLINKDEAAVKQERLSRQFKEFTQALLRLAQRLEASSKPEDRDRAVVIKKAIERANTANVDGKFDTLIAILRSKELNLDDLQKLSERNRDLVKDIQEILNILLTDNRDAELKAERERVTQLLKMLNEIIRQQQNTRAWTERGGKDKESLGKDQNQVTQATKALSQALGKDGKPGEGKPNEGKPGEGKPGEGKPGEGKPGEQKPGEQKPGEQKPGEAKKLEPKEKPGEQKPGEGKPGEGKPGEGKPGEGKPGEGKPGEGKPGEGKPGEGKPGDKQDDQDQPGGKNTPGRKQIQEAIPHQQDAEKNIDKDQRPKASDEQDKAIQKLKDAQRKLEEYLAQLREEEMLRKLADLQRRCERMRQMQIEVKDGKEGTIVLDRTIRELPEKKATRTEQQRSLALADREEEIIREANKAMAILEAEGSAVAFYEIFVQVRSDMQDVHVRLRRTDVGSVTQLIEQQIIETLGEMIEALKKKQQEMKDKQQGKKPPSGQPGNDQLIDILAELKMIRAMQFRIYTRTQAYAKEYPGEQAPSPAGLTSAEEREKAEQVLKELKGLADRQEKLVDVTKNIAKGKNK